MVGGYEGETSMKQPRHQKLALFLPSLRGGGAERVMLVLAKAFADKGVRVDLLLGKAEGPLLAQVPERIRVTDFNKRHVVRCVPALTAYLRREKPGSLLSAMGHVNFAALVAKRLACSTTRVAISVHNSPSKVKGGHVTKRQLLVWAMRKLHVHADAVIAVSQGAAHDYAEVMRLPKRSVRVIYNPAIDPDVFSKANHRADHAWFEDGKSAIALAAGRLTRQKDYPTLIKAFAKVHEATGARLIILGEGEEKEGLQRLILTLGLSNVISLPGFLPNPYPFMRSADVFVLSSAWEGFGLVLVEAMALGTPVVSVDCPWGPAEILEDGRWGDLVPLGDIDALALAMIKNLKHPGRDLATKRAQDFYVDKIVREYADALAIDLSL
jgi:glycosyltransferase involved in cell wall biosynthesis